MALYEGTESNSINDLQYNDEHSYKLTNYQDNNNTKAEESYTDQFESDELDSDELNTTQINAQTIYNQGIDNVLYDVDTYNIDSVSDDIENHVNSDKLIPENYKKLFAVFKCKSFINLMTLPHPSDIHVHSKTANCLLKLNKVKGEKNIKAMIGGKEMHFETIQHFNKVLYQQLLSFAKIIHNNIFTNLFEGNNLSYPFIGVHYYPNNDNNAVKIDFNPFKKRSTRKRKKQDTSGKKGCFSNQVTFIIDLGPERKNANIKLFCNFNSTITGVLYNKDGTDALEILRQEILKYNHCFQGIITCPNDIVATNYHNSMICAKFSLNIPINREEFRNILMKEYGVYAFFDPDAKYQGVIVRYKWNKHNKLKDGKCYHTPMCNNKKQGDGHTTCRNITISVFQEGNVTLKGSTCDEQLFEARRFIKKYVKNHWKDIIYIHVNNYDKYLQYFPENILSL